MDHLLTLPDARRHLLFDEAGARLGLSAGSVEKDLWVCWVLRALFTLPTSGRHLTFKGGTSLSKAGASSNAFRKILFEEFLKPLDMTQAAAQKLGMSTGASTNSCAASAA